MRGHNQVGVLDHEIVDWRRWKIKLERLPVRTVVEGNVDARFGAGEKQIVARWVNTDSVHIVSGREAVHQRGPGLTEVGGFEDVRSEVVLLVAFDGDVGGAGFGGGGFDHAYRAPIGHGFWRDVFPMLTGVASNVHQAVVSACPDEVFLNGRFDDREDGVVDFDAGVVFGDGTAGSLLFLLIVASQVRADDIPAHSAVGGFEEDLAAKYR